MYKFIVLFSLLACACASPAPAPAPAPEAKPGFLAPAIPLASSYQYNYQAPLTYSAPLTYAAPIIGKLFLHIFKILLNIFFFITINTFSL